MYRFAIKQYCSREIRKIRHRKGYGVHSPFAYGFITRVIEEKWSYYAYRQIEELYRALHGKRPFDKRKGRLLFRLVNYFKPSVMVECGCEGGYTSLYLQKGNPDARLFCIEPDAAVRATAEEVTTQLPGNITFIGQSIPEGLLSLKEGNGEIPFIYLHRQADVGQYEQAFDRITPLLPERGVVIVDGIRQKKEILKAWKTFTQKEKIKVTFDLYTFGISVCSPKLNRQNYIVPF